MPTLVAVNQRPMGLSGQLRALDMCGPSLDCRVDSFRKKHGARSLNELPSAPGPPRLAPSESLSQLPLRKQLGVAADPFPFEAHQTWALSSKSRQAAQVQMRFTQMLFDGQLTHPPPPRASSRKTRPPVELPQLLMVSGGYRNTLPKPVPRRKPAPVPAPGEDPRASALNMLSKAALVEIKSYGNPPPLVAAVMKSICVLFGDKKPNWNTAKTRLAHLGAFTSRLAQYEKAQVTKPMLRQVKQLLKGLKLEQASNVSEATAGLFMWVCATTGAPLTAPPQAVAVAEAAAPEEGTSAEPAPGDSSTEQRAE
jgi:hypothetical protein